jgi:hypothetical protein
MDTDDLSKPTYNGVIIEAEKFNHDLTLQFGVMASDCIDDDDYLNQAEEMIKNWHGREEMSYLLENIFYGEPVDDKEFRNVLNKIISNITEIRKTPMEEREYEDWG